MKTPAIDTQLEYELQELYILSKHWASDISFVEDEVRILKDILNKYLIKMGNLQVKEARNFEKILGQQDATILDIKSKISKFLTFMEPFVTGAKKEIGINLIEEFTELQAQITSLSEYVKVLKKSLFSFTEEVMRADGTMFL
jgi:wobble nucleotide-excising tRNase